MAAKTPTIRDIKFAARDLEACRSRLLELAAGIDSAIQLANSGKFPTEILVNTVWGANLLSHGLDRMVEEATGTSELKPLTPAPERTEESGREEEFMMCGE